MTGQQGSAIEIIAHYRGGRAIGVYAGWLCLSVFLALLIVFPTTFMRERPVFSVLVVIGFVASLAFIWKFIELIVRLRFRQGAAIYLQDGRLHTISGSASLDEVVDAMVVSSERPHIQVTLASGHRRLFGTELLREDADTIARRIRDACHRQ